MLKNVLIGFKKRFILKSIFIFDLIHDNVKLRLIIPLSFLFAIYASVTYLLESGYKEYSIPYSMEVVMSPSDVLYITDKFKRYPIIKVSDQYSNGLPNVNASFVFLKKHDPNIYRITTCDFFYYQMYYWTNYFISYLTPCSLSVSASQVLTDDAGYASFDQLVVTHASQGYYYYMIQINENLKITNKVIYLSSKVSQIEMHSIKPKTARLGVPINPQPVLKVIDKLGNPIINLTVDALSTSYGYYNREKVPNLFDPDNDKFAILQGDLSNPSNASGFAEFQNLRIKGSSHPNVYILFYVDDQLSRSWKPVFSEIFNNYINYLITPIIINYEYKEQNMKLIRNPSSSAIEGKPFEIQPMLQLIDAGGNPIPEVLCFARLKSYGNIRFPVGNFVAPHLFLSKILTKAVTGNYTECLPFPQKSCFTPIPTDTNGLVKFSGLGITQLGNILNSSNAKIYIQFVCGLAKSNEIGIDIQTSIKQITIFPIYKTIWTFFECFFEFSLSIKITDSNDMPVKGKIIEKAQLLYLNKTEAPNAIISNRHLFSMEDVRMYSTSQGTMTFFFILHPIFSEEHNFLLQILIDNVSLIYDSQLLIYPPSLDLCNKFSCMYMNLSENTSNYYNITNEDTINLTFYSYDATMMPFENTGSEAYTFPLTDIVSAMLPNQIFLISQYSYNLIQGNVSISGNEIRVENYRIDNIHTGTYLGYIFDYNTFYNIYIGDYYSELCSISFPIFLNFTNIVGQLILLDLSFNSIPEAINIYYDDIIPLYLFIKDSYGHPLSSFYIDPTIYIYEIPLIFLFTTIAPEFTDFFIITSDEEKTNSYGLMRVNLQISKNCKICFGNWILSIGSHGIYSIPLTLSIHIPSIYFSIISKNDPQILKLLQPIPNPILVQAYTIDENIEVQNIPIIAFFRPNNINIKASIDIVDSLETKICWNKQRFNFTNASGIASFDRLSILSFNNSPELSYNSITGHFYFTYALDMNISTLESEEYTFYQFPEFNISKNHDSQISIMFSFIKSVYVLSYFQESYYLYPLIFKLMVNYSRTETITMENRKYITNYYFYPTYYCPFVDKGNDLGALYSACSIYMVNNPSNRSLYKAAFDLSYLIGGEKGSKLDLVICYFDYCLFPKKELASIELGYNAVLLNILPEIIPRKMLINESRMIILNASITLSRMIGDVSIHCNIHSLKNEKDSFINMDTIISIIAQDTDIVDAYNEYGKYHGISESKLELLNDIVDYIAGRAQIDLQFVNVNSGYHVFECIAEGADVVRSEVFYLENYIDQVIILNDKDAHLKIKLNSISDGILIPTSVILNTTIQLSIIDKNGIEIERQEQYIITEISTEEFYNYISTNQDNNDDSVFTNFLKFLEIVSKGGSSLFITNQRNPVNKFFNFYYENGIYLSRNPIFEINQPGTYRFRFNCRGIYSNFSKPLYLEAESYNDFITFCIYYKLVIFVFSMFLIIIFSSIHFHYFFLIVNLGIMAFNIFLYFKAYFSSFTLIYGLIILFILLIIILFTLLVNWIYGSSSFFFVARKDIFYEYCRNTFFSVKNLIFVQEFHTFSLELRNFLIQERKGFTPSSAINKNKYPTRNFEPPRENQYQIINQKKNENENEKGTFIKKIFHNIIKKYFTLNSKDAFYFPQRFIFSLIIMLFTLFFCIVQDIFLTNKIISLLSILRYNLSSSVYSSISEVKNLVFQKMAYQLTNTDLNTYYEIRSNISNLLSNTQVAFFVSAIISNVLICLLYIISIILAIKKFKKLSIKSRYSNKVITLLSNFKITEIYTLPTLIFANTIISYLADCFILTIILTILFLPLFWTFIWDVRYALFLILFPGFCESSFVSIINYFTFEFEKTLIVNINIFQIGELVELILCIVGGLSYSLSRIIFGFIHLLLKLPRFDKPVYKGVYFYGLFKDDLYYSFMSNVHLHSIYSNPIFNNWNDLLISVPRKRRNSTHKKLWIAWILKKLPNNCRLRKINDL